MSPFHKEASCKSSTINGLLYAHKTLIVARRCDNPAGTDFEMHAIWQGYIEDPAAKVFVARKACTITLCEAQGT
jgi:hypothetical protein